MSTLDAVIIGKVMGEFIIYLYATASAEEILKRTNERTDGKRYAPWGGMGVVWGGMAWCSAT